MYHGYTSKLPELRIQTFSVQVSSFFLSSLRRHGRFSKDKISSSSLSYARFSPNLFFFSAFSHLCYFILPPPPRFCHAYYVRGEGHQNITTIKHDRRARATYIPYMKKNAPAVLFRISLGIDSCGGITNKTVAPLHVAGRCSQHASFSGRLPSVCGDR